MLIRLTKSNQSAQIILLILLTIAFWARNFVVYTPTEVIEPQTFLYGVLFSWTTINVVLAKILALGCVLLQAFLLSEVVKTHSLSKNPVFVGLIYIVLMSAQNDWLTMQPFLLSNLFIIAGFSFLFRVYDQKESYEYVFNVAFSFALAALISASLLPFALVVFVVFVSYPINKWREWVIAVLGLMFPFFLLFLWASLASRVDIFFEFVSPILTFEGFEKIAETSLLTQIFLGGILVLSLAGMVFMRLHLKENEISQRKKIVALMFGALWVVFAVLCTFYTPIYLATFFVFAAFFIAEWFCRTEREWLSELVFGAFLVVAFGVQWF